MFTGWWQIITDSTRPATYILVSNSFNDDLPNVTQLVARFVRIKEITLNLPQDHSGYFTADMYYRYYYTQASQLSDIRIHNYTETTPHGVTPNPDFDNSNNADVKLILKVPVDTYLDNVVIYSSGGKLGGFYFGESNDPDNPDVSSSTIDGAIVTEDYTSYKPVNDLDNLIGVSIYQ